MTTITDITLIVFLILVLFVLGFLWWRGIGRVANQMSSDMQVYIERDRKSRKMIRSLETNYQMLELSFREFDNYLDDVLEVVEINFQQLKDAGLEPLKKLPTRPPPKYAFGKPDSINAELVKKIKEHFDQNEIGDLAFSVGIQPDAIIGDTRSVSARNLVSMAERQDRLDELIVECRNVRPHVDWPQ